MDRDIPDILHVEFSEEDDEPEVTLASGVPFLVPCTDNNVQLMDERRLKLEDVKPMSPRCVAPSSLVALGQISHYIDGDALLKEGGKSRCGFVVQQHLAEAKDGEADVVNVGTSVFSQDGVELGSVLEVMGKVGMPEYICVQPTMISPTYAIEDFVEADTIAPLHFSPEDYPPSTTVCVLKDTSLIKVLKDAE